jgi:S-adenosylmethionine hydrolase
VLFVPLIPWLVPAVITLTTDFGLSDPYVGVMKGVILGIAPETQIVDISHAVPPQNVGAGSIFLRSAHRYFPMESVHVGVVDPGVGTLRKAVAIRTPTGTFVGPDNGLFAPVLMDQGFCAHDGHLLPAAVAVELQNPNYRLPETSSTFHGRDIFAPAAAHLARGVEIQQLGPRLTQIERGRIPEPEQGPREITGEVIHIDHFGNAISNIQGTSVPTGAVIRAAGREIGPLSSTYQSGPVVALVGSTGLVEIAVRNGSAERQLGLSVGDPVGVRVP